MVFMGSDPPPPKRLPRHFRNDDIPTDTFTPRAYQVELLDAALHKNTIVCLGSSSGNTFLSVMLIRELSDQLRLPLSAGGKRSIVLVNNEGAIFYLSQVIQHHTDLCVSKFHDDDGEQFKWNSEQWSDHIQSHHIIIMPPKLFCTMLSMDVIQIDQLNLVIFDECHLILGDHPFKDIMNILQKAHDSDAKKKNFPRILGLTSCFTSKKCRDPKELETSIRSLEGSLLSKAETATLVISERYGLRPKELVIECENYEDETGISILLENILHDGLDFLHDSNAVSEGDNDQDPCAIPITALSECLHILHTLGPWCADCIAKMLINQLEKIDKFETGIINKKLLHFCASQLRMISAIFDSKFSPNYDVEELLMYTSPKVRRLVHHLRKYRPECDFMIVSSADGDLEGMLGIDDSDSDLSDDSDFAEDEGNARENRNVIHVAVKKETSEENGLDPLLGDTEKYLCGIVFVDDRNVALVLNKFLEEVFAWDETLCFVKSHHITGQGIKGAVTKKENGKLYRKQEDVLRKFRMQDLNLLISTSVLEEGIDVPKCNLIVKFDPPKTYKSYSQSKGRARARNAEYLVLVDENKMEAFQKEYDIFRCIEKVLINRNSEKLSLKEELDDDDNSDIIPPYVPNPDQPRFCVTLNSAIALVNRYCAKLPSDAFTHLTPKCSVEKVDIDSNTMYKANLRLPINSPYKELVQGDLMPTVMLAKREVALRMCEALHKSGELDDTLMPVGKELYNIEEEEEEVKDWEAEDLYGEVRPGTTKRKQYYFKRLASALVGSHPCSHDNYLYSLSMVLTKPISEEQNTRGRKIYAPEESLRGFGIITAKQIPEIPKFPVYTRSGEVMISITMVTSELSLTEEDLQRLGDCHHFIFDNVLRLEKDPMEFKAQQSELGYIVVPLLKTDSEGCGHTIDWDFISKLEQSKHHVKRNILDSKREPFVFNRDEYTDAVVMPSYRNTDQPQPFYVAEICSDLNPLSPFPSPELYETFSQYYTTKYGLTITNFEQPLLDVDHTSARLNLLTPRYMNQKGVALPTSSAETKKARRENLQQKQILVAELCEVHIFPASLWKKAVCLPTILYRINYLLVAEEMRIKISSETGIGLKDLPSDFEFEPLDFGFEIINSKENFTSVSAVLDESKMDDLEEGETEEQSPSSDKGSYSENLSDESPNDNQPETNISDQISSSQANCDTTSVLQHRRSSLTVGNLFSSEGLKNYYKNSALCDNSDCDTDDDDTSDKEGSPTKEDQIKTTDFVEVRECDMSTRANDNEIKASDQSCINNNKASDTKHVKASDNVSKVSDNSKASDKSIDTLHHDHKSPEKILNGQLKVEDSHSSFLNGCSGTTDGKIQITDFATDLVPDMKNLTLSDTARNNSSNTSSLDRNGIEQDVFSGMTKFTTDTGKSAVADTGKSARKNEVKINFPDPKLSLDEDKDLTKFVGPNPCTILQALTMSNANDFFSLERLETIGDSFLKYAITVHLYCSYPGIHEGKLSYLRSKQVSNCNLYRLGKKKGLAECMISTKFEPYENWLPPGYIINDSKRKGSVPKVLLYRNSMGHLEKVNDQAVIDSYATDDTSLNWTPKVTEMVEAEGSVTEGDSQNDSSFSGQCLIPYSLQTLHSIPDKSIADCVESLIGCYLTSCGKRAALQFMHWLGLKVLPPRQGDDSGLMEDIEKLKCPSSPSSSASSQTISELEDLLIGYNKLEDSIGYKFTDRFYLLQAFTHASYHYNTVTDCYQRLEFLGDAILDYIITRHLYEDSCKYSPGVLTDLRSALVNNNIFAALAVKWDFHKYFKAISPPLFHVIEKFVARQKEREDEIDLSDEEENEEEETETVELEVPKALGDIFESLAGAIYLDSGMSLDVVWRVYYRIMKPQIDKYLKSIPKSPVRELLEMEPETAKFEKPERTLEGKIRVNVNVVGKGAYTGVGRNYRIAKSAAAKKALRSIKTMQAEGLI